MQDDYVIVATLWGLYVWQVRNNLFGQNFIAKMRMENEYGREEKAFILIEDEKGKT